MFPVSSLKLMVKRHAHDIDVADDMPLLRVLRNVLGMTRTKFGCGIARRGACAVRVDIAH